MIERRDPGRFRECLSMVMVVIAALGGFYVLIDPELVVDANEWTLKLGSGGFSQEMKGAVVTIMLIGGWQGVQGFWLGASAGGQKQADSMSRIAEQSAPVAAAAAAAAVAPAKTINTGEVNVAASGGVTVNEAKS